MVTVKDIEKFEAAIALLYKLGKIKYPVHLRSGREKPLIDIFKSEQIGPNDHIYGYWDSHELCLLKGVPEAELKRAIIEGHSIALSFPKHNILCSGIAGSLMGVAVGHAWAIKEQKSIGRVFLFCGDMSAEMGIFHEAIKYALNFNLPIKFVISDNGMSVGTDTRATWGEDCWFGGEIYADFIIHFQYTNGYPHSGIGQKIRF